MRHVTPYGFYTITPMPNQPSIALCTDFTVLPNHRGKGMAKLLKEDQKFELRRLHFTYAICTVQEDNEAQLKVLKATGWSCLSTFLDARTGNVVAMYGWNVA